MQVHHGPRGLGSQARTLVLIITCALLPPGHALADQVIRYDIREAVRVSFERSPVLRALAAEVDESRGRLAQARTYPFNPELGGAVGRRSGEVASSTDFGLSLGQEVEIAGQRGKRTRAAEHELGAAEARLLHERRLLAARVTLAYAEAVQARSLLEIENADTNLARQYAAYTRRRFEAGDTSQIDLNLGLAAAGRAERSRLISEARVREAQAVLVEAIGLDPATTVQTAPLPRLLESGIPPVEDLVRVAHTHRADLTAFQAMLSAAQATRELARAEGVPNLRLEGFAERESGTDTIAGIAVSIGLPIFNRNQGRIAEAEAAIRHAQAEEDALRLTIEQEVVSAHARLTSAIRSLGYLEEQVVGTLQESLGLLERSFTAGKISSMELLVFRRELVQSRRDYTEAVTDAWRAGIALDLASGRTPGLGSEEK